jgi:S-adenosyl methyltransferase
LAAHPRTQAFDDPAVPHPARRYNCRLGGRENYKADRASGDAGAAAIPSIRVGIRENRAFLRRAVRFMVDQGIRQLIDIGSGIPAPDCSPEVARALSPQTRVPYVDEDPVVIAHSRALLRSAALPAADEEGAHLAFDPAFWPGPDLVAGQGRGLIGHVPADLCDCERIPA